MRIHEYLEILKDNIGKEVISCVNCGHVLCSARENYKDHALLVIEKLTDLNLRFLTSGEDPLVSYYQYVCPGCGVLFEVNPVCQTLNRDNPTVWDIQVDLDTAGK